VDYEWGVSKEGNVAIDFSEGINISFESPIGIAIRGKKEGEVARVRIGNQRKEVKILKIQ
jgi:transcription elongation GreA/GreB family factor